MYGSGKPKSKVEFRRSRSKASLKAGVTKIRFQIFTGFIWIKMETVMNHPLEQKAKSFLNIFFFRRNSPQWARASLFKRFLDHAQRRTTVGRTPLDE